ncbi:MAG: hypothetical protein ACREC6_12385, partial [Hyphomicrobiaceae bacterium]
MAIAVSVPDGTALSEHKFRSGAYGMSSAKNLLEGDRLLYFADPMCSWCYGFSPVIAALAERFAGRLPIRAVMGGLRAGNTRPMRPQDKEAIRGAW